MRRLVPYLVAAPLVAGIGLVLWQLTTLPAVRAVSPFAILAAGIVGFGLGRRRPGSADVADLSSLLGVALVALAVFSLAFVTRWWGRVGFPLFGVIGVGLAAYGVGHRVDDEKGVRWRLTRDLDGNDGTSQSDRPWLDEDPEWTPDDREGDGTSREE